MHREGEVECQTEAGEGAVKGWVCREDNEPRDNGEGKREKEQ